MARSLPGPGAGFPKHVNLDVTSDAADAETLTFASRKAEPADAAAIADAADADALIFAGLKAMRPEDPLLNFFATLEVKGKNADDCPAEDSENSDEEGARKPSLFDGMTPEDSTRRWRHCESRASPTAAPSPVVTHRR